MGGWGSFRREGINVKWLSFNLAGVLSVHGTERGGESAEGSERGTSAKECEAYRYGYELFSPGFI